MDGMPIQYLDGIDEPTFGLNDLIARRNAIAANPAKFSKMQNPASMLKMYDYAIRYWNTPQRDRALDILEAEEERLIKEGAILDGVDGLDGKFFKKIKKAAKKVTKVAKKAKFVVAPTVATHALIAKKVVRPVAKKAVKVVKKNPVLRKGAILVAPSAVVTRVVAKKVASVVKPKPSRPVPQPKLQPAYQEPVVEEQEVVDEVPAAVEPAPAPEPTPVAEFQEEAAPVEPVAEEQPAEAPSEEPAETPAEEPAETAAEDAEAVGYIHGISEDVLNLIEGIGGLEGGLNGTDDDVRKVYNHLVATRDIIRAKPELVASVQNPTEMLRMFDYAITHFYTPNRDKALGILEEEEERLIASGAILNGIDDMGIYGLDGLDGKFWSKVKKAVKKGAKGALNVAKKVGNAILVLNPLTIAARNGMLVAMRLNMNHMASKLGPAYLTVEQAKAAGITPEDHKKAQDALKKVQSLFQKKLRGKSSSLKKAILSGKRKQWRKPVTLDAKAMQADVKDVKVDSSELNGLGEAVVAASTVAAAVPFIVKATTYVKDLFNKKEKKEFMEQAAQAGKSKKEAKEAWKQQKKGKKGNGGKILDKATSLITDYASQGKGKEEVTETQTPSPSYTKTGSKMENPNPSFLAQHGKKLIIGGALVAIAAIGYNMYKNNQKAKVSAAQPALNGIGGRRRKKASPRKATRKAKPASKVVARRKATKVKSVKLR